MGLLLAVYGMRRSAGFHSDDDVVEDAQNGSAGAPSRTHWTRRCCCTWMRFIWYRIFIARSCLAEEQAARALALNANLASAWAFMGYIHLWSGNPAQTVSDLARATRLDPLNDSVNWKSATAHAYYFLDRHEEALRIAENMVQRNPEGHSGLRLATVCAAFAGHVEVARIFASNLQRIDPAFHVSRLAD